MTTVCFLKRDGEIVGFDISGHTGAGLNGSDILCAAVSSAAYLTANTITDVIGSDADVSVSDGRMKLVIKTAPGETAGAILKGFKLHMMQLRSQKPGNIRILQINTGKEHYYA